MKAQLLLLLTLLYCPTPAAALPSADSHSQPALCNPWSRTLAPLKIGLTRTEAEKILALAHARLLFCDFWGSGQSDTYRMDEHWIVTVCYNYTGVKYGKAGTLAERRCPQNKVMSLPDFAQQEKKKR